MNGCLSWILVPFKVVICFLCFLGSCIEYVIDKNSFLNSFKHVFWFSIDVWNWSGNAHFTNQVFKKGLLKGFLDFYFFKYIEAFFVSILVILHHLVIKSNPPISLKDSIQYHFKDCLAK
jgi:hypothetical protein